MAGQRDADSDDRTPSVRAEPRSMYDARSGVGKTPIAEPNHAGCRSVRAEQSPRSEPPSRLPLAVGGAARLAAADLFNAVLAERWERGDDSVSNRVLADRFLCVDEKQVRQYRDGRKHVPLAALFVLPPPIVQDVVDRVVVARVGERQGLALLRKSVRALRTGLKDCDRAEALRAVHDAQRELLELAAALAAEVR